MRKTCLLTFLICLQAVIFHACGGSRSEEGNTEETDVYDMTEDAAAWVDSVYNQMSIRDRLAQMLMPAIYTTADSVQLERLRVYAEDLDVGGILLLQGDAAAAAQMADTLEAIRDRAPIGVGTFLAVDAETGLGMRFSDAPLFPWNSEISRQADDQVFFDYGTEVGREARITGINMILGPVVDVDRSETGGRGVMERRSIGSDQLRVADLSLGYARGLESQGVVSVVKHFPGHGATTVDSHRKLPVIATSYDELMAIDLLPFRTAVQNGVSAVMIGHIWAQALDSIRRPASFSPIVIRDLLRGEFGFKGLVLVDAVGMGAAKGFTGADAIIAGADIIIAPPDTEQEINNLLKAVDDGYLSLEVIEEACKRILFYKYIKGLPSNRRNAAGVPATSIEERLNKGAQRIQQSLVPDTLK